MNNVEAIPKVEIRECRVSTEYKTSKKGEQVWSGKLLTYYRVIVDGRLVDSLQSRERAEAVAAKLRGAG